MPIRDVQRPASLPAAQQYRYVTRVSTHRGTLGLSVDFRAYGAPYWHFHVSVGPYWPATSPGLIAELRTDVMVAEMVRRLVEEEVQNVVAVLFHEDVRPHTVTPTSAFYGVKFPADLFPGAAAD